MEASLWAEMSFIRVAEVRGKFRDARICVADNSSLCFSNSERTRGLLSLSEVSTVRFRLVLIRVFSAVVSRPRSVPRRRRVDLRLPSSVGAEGGMEAEESRAGVAGGSGLIVGRLPADVGGPRDNSSAAEAMDGLRERAGRAEEAILAARLPRTLLAEPRGRPRPRFAVEE